jgi:hypothetical protein
VLGGAGGLIYGIGINHSTLEHQSKSDASGNFAESALLETFKRTEGRAKFGLELTKDLRAGALLRYRYIESDVLGNFFMTPNERTKYSGSLMGAGVGAQFNAQSASLAVQYLSPLEGKVSILGEDKIVSEPGLLSVCGHLDAFSALSFGACYLMAQHTKDELRAPSTGPNPANQTRVAPKGVHPDRIIHLVGASIAGFDVKAGSLMTLRTTVALEEYERVTDTSEIPKGKSDAANRLDGYRVRLGLVFAKGNVSAEIGADGAQRQKTFENENSGSEKFGAQELNVFGTLGIGF